MAKPDVPKSAISPRRAEDFPEWYQQVIRAADMAESSDVRGCMVIKPWGYGIWENMQRALDAMFKATGHKNAYFPLFIPLSYLQKEAEHVEGFAKECAVVTHHRLELNADGKMVPASPLTEPLVVRPTSETIIGASYAKWVQSYRDLPILINQWANVVRWEMRPRLFLRTTEFLWQEGHTVHETEAEARAETRQMLDVYETFARDHLAIPVFTGEKSESERFPGAVQTLCIEAMVQDRKAIQAGTSHFLGQNFSRSSGIQFQTRDGKQEFGWTTSWGVSTRLVGTVIMMHARRRRTRPAAAHCADPHRHPAGHAETGNARRGPAPRRTNSRRNCARIIWHGAPLEVQVDQRDLGGGVKNWEWIKKGVPLRVELGPRDLESGNVAVSRRDGLPVAGIADPGKPTSEVIPAESEFVRRASDAARCDPAKSFRPRPRFSRRAHPRRSTRRKSSTISSPRRIRRSRRSTAASRSPIGTAAARSRNRSRTTSRSRFAASPSTIRPIRRRAGKCVITGEPSPRRVLWAKSY